MHRATVVLDMQKIEHVRHLLGTKGVGDTLDRALDEVIATRARAATIEQLRTMEGIDEKVLRRARRDA